MLAPRRRGTGSQPRALAPRRRCPAVVAINGTREFLPCRLQELKFAIAEAQPTP